MEDLAKDQDTLTALPQASGPRGAFLLGSITDFRRDQLGFIQRMQHEYGDVARFRLGGITFNLVSHPDGIQHILQENNRNYVKGEFFDPVRQVGGEGLFASEGAHWLRQRRLMQPAFHRQRIAGFIDVMIRQTQRLIERWEDAALTDNPVDISQDFTDLTMRIIVDAMFSTQIEADVHMISDAIAWLLADMNYRFQVPFYPKINFPTLRNWRARQELKVVDEIVYSIINQRRQDGVQANDLLSMLMEARDEETGESMTDTHLRDEVITMFVAGHETTAVLLTWLFFVLSNHPQWEDRLRAEINSQLLGKLPGFADLAGFTELRMAIDETLRLYPPVWITNRTSLQDDEICGYRVNSGEVVGVSPYVTHRLPEFWSNPEQFNPLRFSSENAAGRPHYTYLPFGGGPRQCIGNNFALLEAQVIFAMLVSRFQLQAVPERPVKIEPTVTLRPKDGLWMKIFSC